MKKLNVITEQRTRSFIFNNGASNDDGLAAIDSDKNLKDWQLYVRDNVVYRHYKDHNVEDEPVIGPGHDTSLPAKVRADTTERMRKFDRVKKLIEMRKCVRKILYLQEKWSDEAVQVAIERGEMKEAPWKDVQRSLLDIYRNFKFAYGPINKFEVRVAGKQDKMGEQSSFRTYVNLKKFRHDPDAYLIASIEDFDPDTQTAKPGPIFFERVVRAAGLSRKIETPKDVLDCVLNVKGRVDLEEMERVISNTDFSFDEVLKSLRKDGLIFPEPESESWVTAEMYLSGNVREKLALAIKASERDESYAANVKALRKVLPKKLTTADIDVTLGVPWIPTEIIQQFAIEELGGAENTNIFYVPKLNKWYVKGDIDNWNKAEYEFGTDNKNALELLHESLSRKTHKMKKKDKASKHKELEHTKYKRELIQDHFQNWIWKDSNRREQLLKIYHERFVSEVPGSFNGEHLDFPGASVAIELHPHQQNVAWRNSQKGNTLLAHPVGVGKTFASIASAMEMKRQGMINKPSFEVPNHMLQQFAGDFLKLYPNGNILVIEDDKFVEPGEKAGEKRIDSQTKKERYVKRIREGNYDAIIMTHATSDRLAVSPKSLIQRRLQNLRELRDLYNEYEQNGSPYEVLKDISDELHKEGSKFVSFLGIADRYDISVQIQEEDSDLKNTWHDDILPNLDKDIDDPFWRVYIDAMEEIECEIHGKKNAGPYFEDTGIDYIFKDEAHLYKNLTISSRIEGVSGRSSARAENFYEKLIYLNEKNKKEKGRSEFFSTLMTATPVSNAVAEIYTMQRYMQPDKVKEKGFEHFDAWAAMFTEIEEIMELAPETTHYQMVQRLSKYKNLPELLRMVHDFSDIINNEDFKHIAERLNLNLPKLEGDEIKAVKIDRPASMKLFFLSLAYRAAIQRYDLREFWQEQSANLSDEEIDQVKMIARDRVFRGVDFDWSDEEDFSEYNNLDKDDDDDDFEIALPESIGDNGREEELEEVNGEENIKRVEEAKAYRSMASRDNILNVMNDARMASVDPTLVGFEPAEEDYTKLDVLADHVFEVYQESKNFEYPDKNSSNGEREPLKGALQTVWCDLGVPNSGRDYSVYDAIKDKLILRGIPRGKIRFIHNYKDDKSKAQLFEECRRGEVSVLILSTEKGGTGLNIQKRHYATHFIDTTFRGGSDLAQRLGRLIRQGCLNPVVKAYAYLYGGTADEFLWAMGARKSFSAAQILQGKIEERHADIEDPLTDMMKAIATQASDNKDVLEKARIDKTLAKMKRNRRIHKYDLKRAEQEASYIEQDIKRIEIERNDKKALLKSMKMPKDNLFPLQLSGEYKTPTKIGELLQDDLREVRRELRDNVKLLDGTLSDTSVQLSRRLGQVYGFPVFLHGSVDLTKKSIGYEADKVEDDKKEIDTRNDYKYNFTIEIMDGKPTRIPITTDDFKESKYESLYKNFQKLNEEMISTEDKMRVRDIKKILKEEFNEAALEQAKDVIKTSRVELVNKVLAPYIDLDKKIKDLENNLKSCRLKLTKMQSVMQREFPYEKDYQSLVKQARILEKSILGKSDSYDENLDVKP